MDIPGLHTLFIKSSGVCTDTRNLAPGELYFALKGPNFNGNLFALQALENGASYAIVDEDADASDDRMIRVHDVLTALQDLARYHRAQFDIPVIGITGTNGKTTNKELIHSVLSKKFNTLYTAGNLNNHIGVPLTLLRLSDEHEIAVIEMGANHIGEIRDLCNIALPGFGLITSIGIAHLEGFGTFEGIKTAKGELFEHVIENGGKCFVNLAIEHVPEIYHELIERLVDVEAQPAISYGTDEHPPYTQSYTQTPSLLATFDLGEELDKLEIKSKLIGAFQVDNLLHALVIGLYFDIALTDIKEGLEGYHPSNNRAELKEYKGNTVILDAYNANPPSMKAAIQAFLENSPKPKMAILGDMFELGPSSLEYHQEIVDLVNDEGIDEVILIGKDFARTSIPERMYRFDTTAEAKEWWIDQRVSGYDILIKGSRGVHLEVLLEE